MQFQHALINYWHNDLQDEDPHIAFICFSLVLSNAWHMIIPTVHTHHIIIESFTRATIKCT